MHTCDMLLTCWACCFVLVHKPTWFGIQLNGCKICEHVVPTYNEISSCHQGIITLIKLVLNEIMFMSCSIITSLKDFLKIFDSKGLPQIQGDIISGITKQFLVAIVCLDEFWALPDKAYGDVVYCIKNCSNEDVKAVFQYLLTLS